MTSSLTHEYFRSLWFSLFGKFPVIFLLLISSLILLWSENTHCIFPFFKIHWGVFIGLGYGPFCYIVCGYLNVFCCECNVLQISIRSCWLMLLLNSSIIFLIFYARKLLKVGCWSFQLYYVDLCILTICFSCFGGLLFVAYTLRAAMSFIILLLYDVSLCPW